MRTLRPRGQALRKRSACLLVAATLAFASCVDDAYDLSDISLKMTLGADGVTLPLGKIEQRTVDSLIADKNIGNLVAEDGVYAYRLDSTIFETIDAIEVDPIRNVFPEIDPYLFSFSESALPETFSVKGVDNRTSFALPSLGFGNKALDGVDIATPLSADKYIGTTVPAGQPIELPSLDEQDYLAFTVDEIPDDIGAVRRLWFRGPGFGTLIRMHFTLGALAEAVDGGRVSFELTLPSTYGLQLVDTYGGTASVSGGTLRVEDYPLTDGSVSFVFYLIDRTVDEAISADRTLDIRDEIRYKFSYSGTSNGNRVPAGDEPLFSLEIIPVVADAEVVTNRIVSEPTTTDFDVPIEVEGLDAVTRVDYVAFTDDASNVLVLNASHSDIPLRSDVRVCIYFPETYVFAPGVEGLDGHVMTTTLERLASAGGVSLPLEGIRFEGDEAVVRDGVLRAERTIEAVVMPDFPSGTYRLSEIGTADEVQVDFSMRDTELKIDPERCEMTVGFTEPIDIVQEIDETFDVPAEVAAISFAAVCDGDTGETATVAVSLEIEDLTVDELYFDDIDIMLPPFLEVDHPDYDAETHTVHVDRVKYEGRRTTIARIPVAGVKDVPVSGNADGKTAALAGEVRIKAAVNVPDGTDMDGVASETITLLPEVSLPTLEITHVTGTVDLDLKKYLEPTAIDLSDIRESLGEQNIEINLVAPQIALAVSNPVGIVMVGDIVMQPYDFSDRKLDPIVVRDVRVEAAEGDDPRITRLYITDAEAAPEGYTLCRVEDLSNLVKIIPSKIDVEFDLHVDDAEEQSFAVTGEDYPFDVDYSIRIPLEFRDGASVDYTDTEDVDDTFEDIGDYDITAEDILIELNARSTLPLTLRLSAEFLDADGGRLDDIEAAVDGEVEGYDPASELEYRESQIHIRMNIEKGEIQRLRKVAKIRYRFTGEAVGAGAALKPDQYLSADMKLILKKGITFDLDELMSNSDDDE